MPNTSPGPDAPRILPPPLVEVLLEALALAERLAPRSWRPRIAMAARVLRSVFGRQNDAP